MPGTNDRVSVSCLACARAVASALVLLCCALLAEAAGAQDKLNEPARLDAARLLNDLMTGRGPIGGPFSLADQHGRRVGPGAMAWQGGADVLRLYPLP